MNTDNRMPVNFKFSLPRKWWLGVGEKGMALICGEFVVLEFTELDSDIRVDHLKFIPQRCGCRKGKNGQKWSILVSTIVFNVVNMKIY